MNLMVIESIGWLRKSESVPAGKRGVTHGEEAAMVGPGKP